MFENRFGDARLSRRAEMLYDRIISTGSVVLRRIGALVSGKIVMVPYPTTTFVWSSCLAASF